MSSLEASALPVPAQAGLPRPLWVTRGRGPSSTGSQGPRAVGRWPGDRAVHLRDPGWRRQTHLPVQGPLVQLISGSNPAADLGGLLPGFEGKLRRQDASQLLQGGSRSRQAALTGPALGGARSSRRAWPMPTRPPPPPPALHPGLSLLLPGAGPLHGPGLGALGSSPVRCCRPPQGERRWGGARPLTLSPTLQPSGPHRLPQAEPPQLLQAGFQPLLQGPLLLPHGVGQLLPGGHRAVRACWGQGHVLRGAGPGCLPARPSPGGDAHAGSQSQACPDCGPAATALCHSRKPARLPPPSGP